MTLNVRTFGAGPDVVLLHGWGMDASCWGGVASGLSSRYRVHLVDLPGHGASPEAEDWVGAVSSAFPFESDVIGWSLGGQIAIGWAARCPGRVRRLALVSSTPCFVKRQDWAHGIEGGTFETFFAGLEADPSGTLKRFCHLQSRGGKEAIRVSRALQSLLPGDRPGLRKGLELLLETDLRREVSGLTNPALILHGTGDALTPFAAAQWLVQNMNNARLFPLEGEAHAPLVSDPQGSLGAILEFLDGR